MTQAPDHPEPAQPWLLHGDLPCLDCQYNLRGLVGPVIKCPECGHANDLRDPAPWRKKKLPTGVRVREHWPATAALASFVVMVTLPFLLMSIGAVWRFNQISIPALLATAVFAVVLT